MVRNNGKQRNRKLAVAECETVTAAAERTGIPRSTLISACERNEIVHAWTVDRRQRLVLPASVDAWISAAPNRSPGAKPKKQPAGK